MRFSNLLQLFCITSYVLGTPRPLPSPQNGVLKGDQRALNKTFEPITEVTDEFLKLSAAAREEWNETLRFLENRSLGLNGTVGDGEVLTEELEVDDWEDVDEDEEDIDIWLVDDDDMDVDDFENADEKGEKNDKRGDPTSSSPPKRNAKSSNRPCLDEYTGPGWYVSLAPDTGTESQYIHIPNRKLNQQCQFNTHSQIVSPPRSWTVLRVRR